MVNIRNKRCTPDGCSKHLSNDVPGGCARKTCGLHAKPDTISLKAKRVGENKKLGGDPERARAEGARRTSVLPTPTKSAEGALSCQTKQQPLLT